jgi:hypothetical protein
MSPTRTPVAGGIPFATDDVLARRLRAIVAELREREPAAARALIEVARILDPARHKP